jgi:hypothetical protein
MTKAISSKSCCFWTFLNQLGQLFHGDEPVPRCSLLNLFDWPYRIVIVYFFHLMAKLKAEFRIVR